MRVPVLAGHCGRGAGVVVLDFGAEASAGGSCSTGRGVVCACDEDAGLGVGGVGPAFGGVAVAPGVELRAGALLDDAERFDGERVLSFPDDDDEEAFDGPLTDELDWAVRFGVLVEDTPQSDFPLEAVFGESLQ